MIFLFGLLFLPKIIIATFGYVLFCYNKVSIQRDILPIILILIIAFSVGLLDNEIDYYFFRTNYYYYQLIGMLLFFQYIIAGYGIKRSVYLCIYYSLIQTLFIYSDFIFSKDFLFNTFSFQNRVHYNLQSDSALVGLLLVNIIDGPKKVYLKSLLIFLICLSFSRTNLVLMLLLESTLFIYKRNSSLLRAGVTFMFFVILTFSGWALLQESASSNGYTSNGSNFTSKMRNSVNELVPSDQESLQLINENYRGYEAYLAISSVINDGPKSWLLGKGSGSTISIPEFKVKAQNMSFFHNGYATLFFHGGLLAIVLMLFFQYRILKGAMRWGGYMATGVSLIVLVYTMTIMGLISPVVNNSLLIVIALVLFRSSERKVTLL